MLEFFFFFLVVLSSSLSCPCNGGSWQSYNVLFVFAHYSCEYEFTLVIITHLVLTVMSILKSCEESFGLFFWKPVVAMSLVLCFMNYIHFWKDAYVLFSLIYFLFVCRHNWHCGLHKLWWYEACSKSSSFNYGVISSDVRPCFLMITRVYFVFSSADQKTWWLWV